jgi:histidine ammonia-lyase
VQREEPIYGVSTGFGSNADKLLGGHPMRDAQVDAASPGRSLHVELQNNLIVTHAVCVGEPFAAEVVRAMLCIRVNTLLRGHSGIRVQTLRALAAMLNAGVVPVVPQLGSVGASGDLAPLSHLAIVLIGGGEAFFAGERMPGAQALERAGLQPVTLSYKEGLALNNGTAQMLATGVLALDRLDTLLDTADLAAAMTIDAFAGRLGAFAAEVHALRPHPGQVRVAANLRSLLAGSSLADIHYHLVPRFRQWRPDSWTGTPVSEQPCFDIGWEWVPFDQRHGRDKFYKRFRPFRGGKKHQPQDSYSLRCVPQVHGAVRDAVEQAKRVLDIELNSVTDNPLVFPDAESGNVEQQVISAGHFHGMPLALAMSYVKAAIPVLASISERRLNKLVDPATNDGLPPFLIGNEDGTESGLMIVQYTAAAIVNDWPAARCPRPCTRSDQRQRRGPCLDGRQRSATRAGDGRRPRQGARAGALHRSAGARPAVGHDQCGAQSSPAARTRRSSRPRFPADRRTMHRIRDSFLAEVDGLRRELAEGAPVHPGAAVAAAHAAIRRSIPVPGPRPCARRGSRRHGAPGG